jgi:hypothetical protein
VDIASLDPFESAPWAAAEVFTTFSQHDFDVQRALCPSYALPPEPLPTPEAIKSWTKDKLADFLKSKGQGWTGVKKDLLERALHVLKVVAGFGGEWLQSAVPTQQELKDFAKHNNEAWALIESDGWTEKTLIFKDNLVDAYLGDAGKSARIEVIAKSRFAEGICVHLGNITTVEIEGRFSLAVQTFHAYAHVARSRTEAHRTVLVEGLCTETLDVISITSATCLVPKSVLRADGTTVSAKGYKPCR